MNWLLNMVLGRSLQRETHAYLHRLHNDPDASLRGKAKAAIDKLNANSVASVTLGTMCLGDTAVKIPVGHLLAAHGLITGGTGSGKTMFALLITGALIHSYEIGSFGLVDPKGDAFMGGLALLAACLKQLGQTDPEAARNLRRRIVIYDFADSNLISGYNVLARWKGVEPDFFASSRAELLLDLLSGADNLSLVGATVLQKLILLLSEFNLPITHVEDVLTDPALLNSLVQRSKDQTLAAYFTRQFSTTPKPTLLALRRRITGLFASEGVRLSLAGTTAPDFRRLQDEGKIVLINCFGTSISRGVRQILQNLVLSDIRQAVFARQRRERPFLWVCDEAQNFFSSPNLRDSLADLLTMSRSFGTHFLFMTQNLSTAVPDARMLKTLYTNVRWSFSMRGEPGDCAFLKSVLPITGRRARPHTNPFEERSLYTTAEERALLLDEIANLPDRVGYLWLRSHCAEAMRMRTADLAVAQGADMESVAASIKRDATIGGRTPRKMYERLIAERDQVCRAQPQEEAQPELNETLKTAYQAARRTPGDC